MKKTTLFTLAALGMMTITSCFRDPKHPGLEYMPDMAHSVAVETYDESKNTDIYADGLSARTPIHGTIPFAQGALFGETRHSAYMPYHHPNTPEGLEAAKSDVNPMEANEENMAEGKRLFNVYCAPCHGEEGKANGSVTLANNHAFPMSEAFSYYTDVNINMSQGEMFYYTQYGKNSMGSYATQLNREERWKVIMYVKSMQEKFKAENATASAPKAEETKK
jgi:mono/diheme cytochrome c family protein